MIRQPTARQLFGGVAATALALIGVGLFLQHVEGLEPCPLCILQRYAFVLVALFAGVAALLRGRGAAAVGAVGLAAALTGAGIAAWHVRLQLFPPEIASCGPGLDYLVTQLPLSRALPRIFAGGADCSEITWRFAGLTLPMWSLFWLAALGAALAWALWRRRHAHPRT